MDMDTENPHLRQAKLGRRKLRLGSLLILVTMVFIALFSLYFVMTVNIQARQFVISPIVFFIVLLCTIPIVGIGIHLMVKGYRMETKGYEDDLKEAEKRLQEITSQTEGMKS